MLRLGQVPSFFCIENWKEPGSWGACTPPHSQGRGGGPQGKVWELVPGEEPPKWKTGMHISVRYDDLGQL